MPASNRLRSSLLLSLLFVATVLPARGQSLQGDSDLARDIRAILESEAFENAFWGVHVLDLQSSQDLFAYNANKSFVPASNTKLYTTAAALDQLGADFRFQTRVYVNGRIEDGVLHGNLIVRGAADPTIGTHYEPEEGKWEEEVDATEVFRQWADSLRAAGIVRIEGDIIGDDDVIDDVPLGPGWSWDDQTFYYSAQLSGLPFNDNVIHLFVEARRTGMPANIRWYPFNTDYIDVINRTRTIHPDSTLDEGYERRPGTNVVDVTTLVPQGRKDVEEITVENPTTFFVHVLRETLMRTGIPVSGRAVDVDELSIKPDYSDPEYRLVASRESPPLSEIVSVINKPSQNLYADLLLKRLGAEFPVEDEDLEPGSWEMGVETAMRTFVKAGVDTSRIALADGSGLSRFNLVTPEMTTALLRYMWQHPDRHVRDAFYESLPLAGRHGTLQNRMQRGPASENVRAKTGSLNNVSSLSGYVEAENGRRLAFSMMSNHFTVRTRIVRDAQDAIAEILARSALAP